MLGPVPVDFILFGLTLAGVAVFQRHTLQVALGGLAVILLYKLGFAGFRDGTGFEGLAIHLEHEWVILSNLLLLLLGFALLSRHFEESRAPLELPRILPDDWKGGFMLLWIVFLLSSFLDNIAAAIIGGTMARAVFRGKVHLGYLAAIVAASNAGGSGSVVGDTTTTMMWIDGVSPLNVLDAYVAACAAMLFVGFFASKQQHAHSPIVKDMPRGLRCDWTRLGIVAAILGAAIAANVLANLRYPQLLDQLPVIGLAVWGAIVLTSGIRRPDWGVLPEAVRGSAFLLSLVLCASLMPVESLPKASWPATFGLGFLSSVFDNIPLTALALKQGGYDWGMLAYAVGFGGSMIWFGSSAGVAISNSFPEARSVTAWVRQGWHVAVGYVLGFFVLLAVLGWEAQPKRRAAAPDPPAVQRPRADTAVRGIHTAVAVQPIPPSA